MPLKIIIQGPQGSGKTTLATLIRKMLDSKEVRESTIFHIMKPVIYTQQGPGEPEEEHEE